MSLTVQEIEARMAARRTAAAETRTKQYIEDLEALDTLEEEHGFDRVRKFELNRYCAGLPTFLVIRVPKPVEYKRFIQQVHRAKDDRDKALEAQDAFALVSLVYPAGELVEKVRAEFPQLLAEVSKVAGELCQARSEAEGKG